MDSQGPWAVKVPTASSFSKKRLVIFKNEKNPQDTQQDIEKWSIKNRCTLDNYFKILYTELGNKLNIGFLILVHGQIHFQMVTIHPLK